MASEAKRLLILIILQARTDENDVLAPPHRLRGRKSLISTSQL